MSHLSQIAEHILSWFVIIYSLPDSSTLRVFHSKQLLQPLAKTVSHYNSFFISAVRLWNSLPRDIVQLDSLSLFKSSLKLHLCM